MKIGAGNLMGMLSSRTTFLSSKTKNPEEAARESDSAADKRLHTLQEGLQRLQSLPSSKSAAKQKAMSKVALLKQRLEALKAMLLYASPEVAKALARELRGIAHELASIGKSLGASNSGGGGTSASALNVSVNGATASASSPDVAQAAEAAVPEESTGESESAAIAEASVAATSAEKESGGTQPTTNSSKESNVKNSGSGQDDEDRSLRALLRDARKLLKEVINQLKAKLNPHDKEAKKDLLAIEKSLRELDQALEQGSGQDFYTAAGDLSSASGVDGLSVTVEISGVTVDTAA